MLDEIKKRIEVIEMQSKYLGLMTGCFLSLAQKQKDARPFVKEKLQIIYNQLVPLKGPDDEDLQTLKHWINTIDEQ